MVTPYLQTQKRRHAEPKGHAQSPHACEFRARPGHGLPLNGVHCTGAVAPWPRWAGLWTFEWPFLPALRGQGFGGSQPWEQLPVFDRAANMALSPPTLTVSYSGRREPGKWGRNKEHERMPLKVSYTSSVACTWQGLGQRAAPASGPGPRGGLWPRLSHMLTIKLWDKRSPSPRTKRGWYSLVTGQLLALGAGLACKVARLLQAGGNLF